MPELKDRLRALELIQAPDLRDRIRGWEPTDLRTEPVFRRLGVVLWAFIIAVGGMAFVIQAFRATEQRTQPATTIENGKIAFVSETETDLYVNGTQSGIFVVNFDGSGRAALVDDPEAFEWDPAWSSDGSRIAFVLSGEAAARPMGLYVANSDGSDVTLLFEDGTGPTSPSWSPDGRKIVFETGHGQEQTGRGNRDVYLIDVGSGELSRLTDDPARDEYPALSPNGSRIAFTRQQDGVVDIYVMNVDGTEVTQLTGGEGSGFRPAWSPDGTKIAFERDADIYVMNADGSGLVRLTEGPAEDREPTWSPDGRWIAFVRDEAGPGLQAIWLMRTDGTGLTELAGGFEEAGGIDWQPLPVPPDGTETPRPTPTSSFPLTYPEGENDVMPIAFLNGTTAEMVYPSDLPLEQVAIQPTGSLYDGVPDFRLNELTSKFVVWRSAVETAEPIESYDPPLNGIVRRWGAEPADDPQTFRLGQWLVQIPYATLADGQRRAFLDSLVGLETEGGFLILEATPPLSLWGHEGGELVTQIYFDVDDLQILDRCIDFSQSADESFMRNGIRVFRIIEGAAVGVDFLSWCDRNGEFGFQVNEGPVADALIDGLSFRNVQR